MTIKSAASALVDDIVEAGSFSRTQVSACDYGVIEKTACALVIQPGESTFTVHSYGAVYEDAWGLRIEGFLQDTGKVPDTVAALYDFLDAIRGSVVGGSNLNTATRIGTLVSINYNPDVAWDYGGLEYLRVIAIMAVREDP